jgi:hypothetical protein
MAASSALYSCNDALWSVASSCPVWSANDLDQTVRDLLIFGETIRNRNGGNNFEIEPFVNGVPFLSKFRH